MKTFIKLEVTVKVLSQEPAPVKGRTLSGTKTAVHNRVSNGVPVGNSLTKILYWRAFDTKLFVWSALRPVSIGRDSARAVHKVAASRRDNAPRIFDSQSR